MSENNEEILEEQEENLRSSAHLELVLFTQWLHNQVPSGSWYSVRVVYNGVSSGTDEWVYQFSKDPDGAVRCDEDYLQEWLSQASTLFMPDTNGFISLAEFSSATTDYTELHPSDLQLKTLMMWNVEINDMRIIKVDQIQGESIPETEFINKYLVPAWDYTQEAKAEIVSQLFPNLVEADTNTQNGLTWVVQSFSEGKHQLLIVKAGAQGQVIEESIEVVVTDTGESVELEFKGDFEEFFARLRDAALSSTRSVILMHVPLSETGSALARVWVVNELGFIVPNEETLDVFDRIGEHVFHTTGEYESYFFSENEE